MLQALYRDGFFAPPEPSRARIRPAPTMKNDDYRERYVNVLDVLLQRGRSPDRDWDEYPMPRPISWTGRPSIGYTIVFHGVPP